MTKKDYERIALVFQKLRPHPPDTPLGYQWEHMRFHFAEMLAADNPRFDVERFKRACQPGANVRARTA